MSAYATPAFFAVAVLLAIPALILGFTGRPLRGWALVATLVMTGLVAWEHPAQGAQLIGAVAWSWAVVRGHLAWRRRHPQGRREPVLSVALALVPLVAIKLAEPAHWAGVGFVGASYLTFRVVQIVLETTDGLVTELGAVDTLIFLLFFPTFASGPIDRSRRMAADLRAPLERAQYAELVRVGVTRFVLGFGYKYGGAVLCAAALSALPRHAWLPVMYAYSGQLFFDFAGYSLMAVGLGMVFGVRTPMNFRLPFAAESIKEFWNRWHITLSFWLRDYVYTRLLMALMKRSKLGHDLANWIALATNMLVMGFWHGLEAQYIAYGAYHGLLMVADDIWQKKLPFHARWHQRTWYRLLAIAVTAHLVLFGFLIFSGRLTSS